MSESLLLFAVLCCTIGCSCRAAPKPEPLQSSNPVQSPVTSGATADEIVERSAALLRSMAETVNAAQGNCADMAAGLSEWLGSYADELPRLTEEVVLVAPGERARLMRTKLGDDTAVFASFAALDACRDDPRMAPLIRELGAIGR